ncbi:hypothetical protein, partial [Xanthomonas campestris]|uniref:hypothetical protein n=3 Tax=Xanthomonas campestris TaxID=339 RepID=UPI0039C001F6
MPISPAESKAVLKIVGNGQADAHKAPQELRYLVAPEKPPITQRPQGLDVCSGVPELPVFATLKAGFWQFPLMHT